METEDNNVPISDDLAKTTSVPIASLDPSRSPPPETSINAVVSLVWPYSSSHRTFALLLAEPDFRLRSKQGQIRVQFRGRVAQALAESHVGIGDSIRLGLDGSEWVEDAATVKTPGRSVPADLLFKSKILLQVRKDGELLPALRFDSVESPPPQSLSPRVITPPEPNSPIPETPQRLNLSGSWRTPGHFRSSLEADHPIAPGSTDLFGDEDAFDDRPTKRTKIWRSGGRWRLVDRASSSSDDDDLQPSKKSLRQLDGIRDYSDIWADTIDFDSPLDASTSRPGVTDHPFSDVHIVDSSEARLETHAESSDAASRVIPPLPQIQTDMETSSPGPSTQAFSAVPLSPMLQPIPSAVLPDVSPLVSFRDSYFPPPPDTPTEQRKSRLEHALETPVDQFAKNNDSMSALASNDLSQATYTKDGLADMESKGAMPSSGPFSDLVSEDSNLQQQKEPIIIDLEAEDVDVDLSRQDKMLSTSEPELIRKDVQDQETVLQESSFGNVNDSFAETLIRNQPSHVSNSLTVTQDPVEFEPLQDIVSQTIISESGVTGSLSELIVPSHAEDETNDLYSQPEPAQGTSESLRVTDAPSQPTTEADAQRMQVSDPMTPEASQGTTSQAPVSASFGHRVDDILDGRLPPTPQLSDVPLHMLTSSEPVQSAPAILEDEQSPKLLRSPGRSSNFRDNEVPESISAWLTSRPQSKSLNDNQYQVQPQKVDDLSVQKAPYSPPQPIGFNFGAQAERKSLLTGEPNRPLTTEMAAESPPASIDGLRTAFSYYTPLSSMDRHVNNSSQIDGNLIDVIVVATSPTAKTERAKSGAKDFYTSLLVTDSSSFPETTDVRVFRPFRASLPRADVGDVMLLRNFSVKSREGKFFLLSGSLSAWHVWRYTHKSQASEEEEVPIWARKTQKNLETADEECKGPPVEIGSEEREFSLAMRYWWESMQRKGLMKRDDMTNGHGGNVIGSDQSAPNSEGIAVET